MNAFLAVLIDTWHESKKQIVVRLLFAFMLLVSILIVALPRTFEAEPGGDGEPRFGLILSSKPIAFFEDAWWGVYLGEEMKVEDLEAPRPGTKEHADWVAERVDERRRRAEVTSFERGVQGWMYIMMALLWKLSLLGFIAACAGYFPHLMRQGAVDAVVSKPIGRAGIFLGKYVGGLTLFSLALLTCCGVVFVGLGARTGVWNERIFLAWAFAVFVAAVLYAFLALIGIVSRSAVLATVFGYVLYVLFDTGLGLMIGLVESNMVDVGENVETGVELARRILPNFTVLNDATLSTLLTIPYLDWGPFVTAGVWTILTLGAGYVVFRRRDF